jgi:uncharacterized repeat protein (TIGR03803 family)
MKKLLAIFNMKRAWLCFIFTFSSSLLTLSAQYTTLHEFNDTNGGEPYGSLIMAGKLLYGMTYKGGLNGYGCIFSIDTNGRGYKDLLDFDGVNGANPNGNNLTILGDKFFGMTFFGGANNVGVVFSVDTNGKGYKKLLDFNNTNGAEPYGSITICGNKLFGTTNIGGTNNRGLIFSIDTDGNGYKDIQDFTGGGGCDPVGSLISCGNKLYGTLSEGGAKNAGIVFYIDTNGSGFKDIHDFNDTNGSYPTCSLILSGGTLYGMASNGGSGGFGNIFSLDTSGADYKELCDFYAYNGKLPDGPNTSLILAGNKLYTMTPFGGPFLNYGNIFSLDTNGMAFKDMFEFDGTNGRFPYGYLILSGKSLYGLARIGGTFNNGVIFKIDTSTVSSLNSINEFTESSGTLKLFPNPNNGRFTIQSSVVSGESTVEIYNMLGERIHSTPLSIQNSTFNISISGQPAGIYMYRVITETGNLVSEGKFVIE